MTNFKVLLMKKNADLSTHEPKYTPHATNFRKLHLYPCEYRDTALAFKIKYKGYPLTGNLINLETLMSLNTIKIYMIWEHQCL